MIEAMEHQTRYPEAETRNSHQTTPPLQGGVKSANLQICKFANFSPPPWTGGAPFQKGLIDFLDFPLHAYTLEETVELILTHLRQKQIVNHMVLNAAKLVYAQKDPCLREAIFKSHIINADGQSIVWGAALLGKRLPERVAGIDLFFRLLREFETNKVPVYFLGARDEVLKKIIDRVSHDYQKLPIAGYRNGYFSPEEEGHICEVINRSKAQALFLGISSPKKEIFLLNNSFRLTPYFRMGVGGSFDILAGDTRRAPKWIQKAGFEWLYRIYQEPGRMWKRYAVTNTLYIYHLITAVLKPRG